MQLSRIFLLLCITITPSLHSMMSDHDYFFAITLANDSYQLRTMLAQNAQYVNVKDKDGCQPLHYAAQGTLETIDLLLTYGANAQASGFKGETALHYAACNYRDSAPTIIARLIAHGADLNAMTIYRETPLHMAAKNGFNHTTNELLRLGADKNVKDFLGNTPLHWAARHGHTEIVYILCTAGANLLIQNFKGQTPANLARRKGHCALADILDTQTIRTHHIAAEQKKLAKATKSTRIYTTH